MYYIQLIREPHKKVSLDFLKFRGNKKFGSYSTEVTAEHALS